MRQTNRWQHDNLCTPLEPDTSCSRTSRLCWCIRSITIVKQCPALGINISTLSWSKTQSPLPMQTCTGRAKAPTPSCLVRVIRALYLLSVPNCTSMYAYCTRAWAQTQGNYGYINSKEHGAPNALVSGTPSSCHCEHRTGWPHPWAKSIGQKRLGKLLG